MVHKTGLYLAILTSPFILGAASPTPLPPELSRPYDHLSLAPTEQTPLEPTAWTPTPIANPKDAKTPTTTDALRHPHLPPHKLSRRQSTSDATQEQIAHELSRAYTVEDRLELVLARMRDAHLLKEDSSIWSLAKGWTNHNFLAQGQDKQYFIKVAGKDSLLLGIDRDREMACHQIAAAASLAPKVVAYYPQDDALVTEFVSGEALPARLITRPKMLQQVAQLINRCHHLSTPFPSVFNPFDTIRSYRAECEQRGIALPRDVDQAFTLLGKIEKAVRYDAELCPCHLDLHGGNMIYDGQQIWLVDWEFAAMANPLYDLASFASSQHLNNQQMEQLLTYYQGNANRADKAELLLYRAVADLQWALWAYLEAGISDVKKDYEGLANLLWRRYVNTTGTISFWRSLLLSNPDAKDKEHTPTVLSRR